MPVLPSYREISQLICHARSSYPYIHFSIDIVWLWYITRSCFSSLYHPTMVCCSLITSRKQCSFHKNVIILRCFSKSALFLIYQRLPLNSRLAPVYCIFPLLVSLPLPSILFFLLISLINIFIYSAPSNLFFSSQSFPGKLPYSVKNLLQFPNATQYFWVMSLSFRLTKSYF